MWVFGAGAAVLMGVLVVLGWLTLRRGRARRALERSFQREWFGLARWAPLASADEEPAVEPAPEEPWYVEGAQRPLKDLAAATNAAATSAPDATAADTTVTGLDLDAPWPPSSHEEWVAVLTDADGAGPPIERSPDQQTEAPRASGPTAGTAAEAPQAEAPAPDAAAATEAQAPSAAAPGGAAEPAAGPPADAPGGPKYGSPEALASLASNLAPVPEYAPLAAELASFAAELTAMINDRDSLEAGDTAQ
jgi:hypothetical protein